MEQGNGYTSEGGDRTAHAERLLASRRRDTTASCFRPSERAVRVRAPVLRLVSPD